ncbi:uncharacterized protein Z518_04299 [Rhinocladiella mackenziei CBS 650.93]|uniref:Nuclear pore complex protein NUP96 C-terminal domain-containing protein n=1 Tax=Rhinocladiella mackenziei CBS 650.93 TaxID=1442369 RepID=A0A0D2IKU4_9EURO|nr:uncharacterized protein Z518_04299 [Rhinocladiella mackenziei CBS 650.93]KIX06324.1 hypothetical protein Z518_04299 [Rhinocladiella mackenziei CBS 650.93]
MTETDKLWHASFKPHFTTRDALIYKSKDNNIRSEPEGGWITDVLVGNQGGRRVALTSLQGKADFDTTDTQSLLGNAQVVLVDETPLVKHIAVPFSKIKDQLVQRQAGTDELDLYELAHVLFDEYEDEFTLGLNRQQKHDFEGRIRKDRLSKFLASLVWRRHGNQIKAGERPGGATAAILQLTAKNVKAACDALMQEKDFHLMMLVAQIEQADDAFQEDMANQLDAWREQGVISEMTEEIRVLYEILAGNTNICQGKSNAPIEDRATTFAISEKFEFDWIQAFCLCLWYGRQKNADIYEVVKDFQEKLTSNQESASPISADGNEDPLWTMLELFASNAKGKGAGVEKPVFPQALTALSQAWDCQKVFRLHHAVAAAVPGVVIDQHKADDLAMCLAFEYSARGNIVGSIYAILHVGNSTNRMRLIKDLLAKHAAALPSPPESDQSTSETQTQASSQLWTAMTTSFKLPSSWIFQAKALLARSSNSSLTEFNYLILANAFTEAHDCLLRRVAPRLVIDEDWDTLKTVLAKFGENIQEKVDAGDGTEWKAGGGIYSDFVSLMAFMDSSTGRARSSNAEMVAMRKTLLQRLQSALTSLNSKFTNVGGLHKDKEKLEERVALCEMGRAVARMLELDNENGIGHKKPLLDLPLTEDVRLSHARALGVEYYRGLMAMAR